MLLEKKDILPSKKISTDPFGLVDANPNVYGEIKTAHFLASFSENARLDNLLYINTYLNESISRSKPKLNTANPYLMITQMLVWHMNAGHYLTYKMLTPEAKRKSPRLKLFLPQ